MHRVPVHLFLAFSDLHMLVFCYHNGALGHTITALMDSCTEEGNAEFPVFIKGENLHHYRPRFEFYQVKHPFIDVAKEKAAGNTIISASSFSIFGRLLIMLMGFKKWSKAIPEFNKPVSLYQDGVTVQEQIEVLSNTLLDKVTQSEGWFVDADYVLDITSFWNDSDTVSLFLKDCGLHPVEQKVRDFCHKVAESNQEYFDTIEKCVKVSTDIANGKEYTVDFNFFETAMCHMLVMHNTNKRFYEQPRRLKSFPTTTVDYIKLFKD